MSSRGALLTYTIEPVVKHTHTAILFHGRGDNGPDFAQELLASRLSEGVGGHTLLTRFPSCRWVVPSAKLRWSATFEEELCSWFDAQSLSDPTSMENLQMDGIRESITDINKILEEEVDRLQGDSQNIILIGISQGAAVGLWALLYQAQAERKLGAFVGASCWLPFSSCIENFLPKVHGNSSKDIQLEYTNSQKFVSCILERSKSSLAKQGAGHPLLSTPVFLGHGTDDAYVDINLGRQAREILSSIGFNVTWKEYVGADQEGHWFKEPEQLDDIAQFLATVVIRQQFST